MGHSSESVVDAGGGCWGSLSKRRGEELIPHRRNKIDEGGKVEDGRRRIVIVGFDNLDEDDVEKDKDP